MKKKDYKRVVGFLAILVFIMLIYIVKQNSGNASNAADARYTGRDLTQWNILIAWNDVILPNTRPYIIKIPAWQFKEKVMRFDVTTGTIDVSVTILNNGQPKKVNGGDSKTISVMTQEAHRLDGTAYNQTRPSCLVIGEVSDECTYIINGNNIAVEKGDDFVVISLRNLQIYGNPVFNWSMK